MPCHIPPTFLCSQQQLLLSQQHESIKGAVEVAAVEVAAVESIKGAVEVAAVEVAAVESIKGALRRCDVVKFVIE